MIAAAALALVLLALAFGAFSSAMFVWQWITGSAGVASAALLFTAILAIFSTIFLSIWRQVPRSRNKSDGGWIVLAPVVCMLIGAVYAASSLVQNVRTIPRGAWDAWAVWNLHARFLYRGGSGVWLKMFDPAMAGSNMDYPLLLSGLVSSGWNLTGAERPFIPIFFAVGFVALTIGILGAAASTLTRDKRGWFVALILLATPTLLGQAASQAADIPLGVYALCTVVLLQFAEAWPKAANPLLILAGLSAGFAAWTKNEGLLFVVALIASIAASFVFHRDWGRLRTRISMVMLGLAPMLAVVAAYKLLLAPTNNPIQTFEHATSAARYQEIVSGFIDQAKGFGGTWHTGAIHPFVLVVLFLLLYVKPITKITRTSIDIALLVGFMLAGYVMVYAFSAFTGVGGYIGNSLDRLYLQLWPSCLFLVATFQCEMPASDRNQGAPFK